MHVDPAPAKPPPIACQRALFDIPADIAYFNCASLAPLMRAAVDAGHAALTQRSQPWLIGNQQWFDSVEERRSLFAALIGTDADAIALIPASSYGLATAARNLTARPGERIISMAGDFPSNVYAWRAFAQSHGCEVLLVDRGLGQSWTEALLAAIDQRVAIVAVPNVHWTDGALIDLIAIGAAARAAGAKLVVDASQSLGAMPLDLAAVQPDFLIAVGYKWLLGPFGLGYLYVAQEHRDGVPLEESWIARAGSDDFARLTEYSGAYGAGARRYDVGQRSALEATPVATAALRQLSLWTVAGVAATLGGITARIAKGAGDLGMAVEPASRRGPHMIGLRLPASRLAAVGDHFKAAGLIVGVRPGTIRIAPHLYTSDDDIARLLEALASLPG